MRVASTFATLYRLGGAGGEWARAAALGALGAGAEIALALSFAALSRGAAADGAALGSLWPVALALGGAAALRMLGQILLNLLIARSNIEASRALRRVGLDAALRADARGLEPATDVLTRWMERVPRAVQARQASVGLVAWSVHVLLLGGLVLVTSPAIGAAMLAVLVAAGAVATALSRRVRRLAETLAPAQRKISSTLERVTRKAWEIRALRTVELERERLAREVDAHSEEQRRVVAASALASASPLLPALLAIGVLAGAGLAGGIPIAGLVAMLYALVRLASSLTALGNALGVISAAGPALDEIAREAAAPMKKAQAIAVVSGEPAACAISLESVRVDVGGRTVLDAVDLEIAPGEIVALVGPSGVGKTSLLKTVLGLVEPASGSVRVGGNSPSEWAARGGRLGLVTAEPLLFAGTLRENVVYGHAEVSDAEVLAALSRARASAVAVGGLDRTIGEGGEGVSTGERQRVALARALLGNPSLLVLDEPTSALDAELERDIAEVLRGVRGRTTVLVATHRPALLEVCDRVIEIVSGERGAVLRGRSRLSEMETASAPADPRSA